MGQECITACCPTEGTCVLAGTTGKRRCTKPPTLAASPVASLTATAASGLATATVKLAAAPVTSANGGVVDKYKVSLVLAGTSTKYTVETSVSTSIVFKEGSTVLLGGAKIPKGTLCNKKWKVEFSARNGAGYAKPYVTTTAYLLNPAGCTATPATGVRVFVTPVFSSGSSPFGCKAIPAALQTSLRQWLATKAGVAIDKVSMAPCTEIPAKPPGSRRLAASLPQTLVIGLQVTTVTQAEANALNTKLAAGNKAAWATELTSLLTKAVGKPVTMSAGGLSVEILNKTYACVLPGQTCDPNIHKGVQACCSIMNNNLETYQGRSFGWLECLQSGSTATKHTCSCAWPITGLTRDSWCHYVDVQ
ncbi:hypothetical protein COHA_005755 [Chlorella ohadii]|uniref:Uncharacterized protein n=1 Tax=Chlorella ohadii TaxID=2649997 RepID=A0AAD5H557_9CHLO|nr:hypothetical protein COHA_005755 [Chlorella ohadii]